MTIQPTRTNNAIATIHAGENHAGDIKMRVRGFSGGPEVCARFAADGDLDSMNASICS